MCVTAVPQRDFAWKVSSAVLDFGAAAMSLPPCMETAFLLACKCLHRTFVHRMDDEAARKMLVVAEIAACDSQWRGKLLRMVSSYGVSCWLTRKDDISSLKKSRKFMTRCGIVLLDYARRLVRPVTSGALFTLECWLKDCPPNMLDKESVVR